MNTKGLRLNGRQRAFCREYMKDFNCSQAAVRAGYTDKTGNCRILKNPLIAAELSRRMKKMDKISIMTATQVLEGLTREAKNMENSPKDRIQALGLMAKHHGLLIDRHEVGKPGDFAALTDTQVDEQILDLLGRRPGVPAAGEQVH